MDMKFVRSTEGKTRRDKIRTERTSGSTMQKEWIEEGYQEESYN